MMYTTSSRALSVVSTALLMTGHITIAQSVINAQCDVDSYYNTIDTTNEGALRTLVTDTHLNVLPRIGDGVETNVLDALVDLDPGLAASVDPTVRLFMRDIDFTAAQVNTPEGWKRGDVWPLKRGAGRETKASTDLHAKFPTDWEVNSELQDLFWGTCGTVQSTEECVIPAVPGETAASTATDYKIKTPPDSWKGRVARALLYQALRYKTELGLELSDCPPFATSDYGYLSELLRWHSEFPADAAEIERNTKVCEIYQGNRNPFIDFRDLATQMYGPPDTIREGTNTYTRCIEATDSPTATPNACSALEPGDIQMLIWNSDPVDQMVFFPVSDVPESVGSLFVTDQSWNGTHFVGEEGTLEYQVPEGGVRAGRIFAYGVDFPADTGVWSTVDNTVFDLATIAPDNLFVYCLNADDEPHFLSAVTYGGSFVDSGLLEYKDGETALPTKLQESEAGSLQLPFSPNYLYEGINSGTRVELLVAFNDPQNYAGSEIPYDIQVPDETSSAFSVALLGTIASSLIAMVMML